jgi:glycosyltransferase involved in cell wall biosynthesis
MRIAQIAPLHESVPPKYYGGTERIVSYLTEELVALNHHVTLFASADSITRARLVPASEFALRLSPNPVVDSMAHYIRLIELVFREAHQFDILHFHIDYLHFPITRRQPVPAVTTLHGNLSIPDLVPLYKEFEDMNVVSISDAQRQPLPTIRWCGTVHHGIPENLYNFREKPGEYLAFLGRICPEKRLDRAIEIAKRSGRSLKIAAKVDPVDRHYFSNQIEPLLKHPLIELIGEIGENDKADFLGNAAALLFPIAWPEPFGLVLIEAMGCGTPVIAYNQGAVGEIIDEGKTGFVVDNLDDAVAAVDRLGSIDRKYCRLEFEKRFSVRRMASDYLRIYERILSGDKAAQRMTAFPKAA